MKIGIVSDSHGKASRLQVAIEVLTLAGAEAIVHCGDIGSDKCVDLLGAAGVPAYAVAGNMDRHINHLAATAKRVGVNFAWEVVEVPIGDDKHLAATHGNDEQILSELIRDRQFPYVCCGHSHRKSDKRFGPVRVINPGALHHARRHTAAILDTDEDTLQYFQIDP